MAEQTRRKQLWKPLSRFEQITLVATILIWVGVIAFGAGLYIAFSKIKVEQTSSAQATAIARVPAGVPAEMSTKMPVETVPPTAAMVFPSGWSTATPTPTSTSMPDPLATMTPVVSAATPSTVRRVAPTATLSPTAPFSKRPDPTPTAINVALSALHPPSRLIIPAIELDSSIIPVGWQIVQENGYRYNVWEVADNVVGWHKTSAYPGQGDNMVLSGHHNIRGEVFRYLIELEVGSHVLVYAGDQVYYYAVTEKHILKEKGEPSEVRRQNAQWIAPTQDERLTMVTCWPYTNNTHRLVVVARPTDPPDSEGLEE